MYTLFFLVCITSCMLLESASGTWYGKNIDTLAVIKDPVVDLFIKLPIQHNVPAAITMEQVPGGPCHRAHQALAYEVITIVDGFDHDVQILFDNLIYGFDPVTNKPQATFWTTDDHVFLLQDMTDEELAALPGPLGQAHNTLVLTLPWQGYSFGTRFVRESLYDTDDSYGISLWNTNTRTVSVQYVPKNHARVEWPLLVNEDARATFVKLASDLVDHASVASVNGVIPFVWGGSSYTQACTDGLFVARPAGWIRPDVDGVYSGYDVSEFVFRLAQASGIPYVCKTTAVMGTLLRELAPDEELLQGDLVWFPGYTTIVSDIVHNEIIGVLGYSTGYGKVARMPLSERFAAIATCDDLLQAYRNKLPLTLLKRDGSTSMEVPEFRLLRLVS